MGRFKRVTVLLAGILCGIMAGLMYLGGSVSVSSFLKEGMVYDFSRSSLTASGNTWVYDEENKSFTLVSDKAVKRFALDGESSGWRYLYLTIDRLSVQELPAELRYYNNDYEVLFSQEVTLVSGENVILLNPELQPVHIGLYVKKQKGVTISLLSMQMREKERTDYAVGEFLAVAAAVFLLFLILWTLIERARRRHPRIHCFILPGALTEYLFLQLARVTGNMAGGRMERTNRRSVQTLLFSLLFFWLIFTNVVGWGADPQMYRYQVLGSMVLLFAAGGFCLGRDSRDVRWNSPVAIFWVLFWVGTMISDFFAGGKFHFYGYGMLLAGGFFIYQWNRMEKPQQMFEIWSDALEIVFFLSMLFCLLFRPKLLAVQYNGVFLNPQENAMFALLLFVTFAVDLERQMKKNRKGIKVFLCFSGMALAVYMVLRAEDKMGYVVAVISGMALLIRAVIEHDVYIGWVRENTAAFAGAVFVSVMVSAGFHMGINVVPDMLGTSLEYKRDMRLSAESEEILAGLAAVSPDYVKNIVTETDGPDARIVRMAYVRELSLFGNGGEVRVSGKAVSADNGYLFMAYRYGIFILVPLLMYQIAVLHTGISGILSARKEGREKLWIFGVMVSYVVFLVKGNVQLRFAHPLWMCVYLGSGFWFTDNDISDCIETDEGRKKEVKEEKE